MGRISPATILLLCWLLTPFPFSLLAEANTALQQTDTALHTKEVECSKLAEERDRLATQLAEQAELLQKAQKEAEVKESSLLAESETERFT